MLLTYFKAGSFSSRTVPNAVKIVCISNFCSKSSEKTDILLKESHLNGSIWRLVLNEPKKRNALSLELIQKLKDALQEGSTNDVLRTVIIAGTPPAFSAGHNLKELQSSEGLTNHARLFTECTKLMQIIQAIQVPVIAEVNGVAAAAGCQLVAACDLAIAAENATFSTPGIKAGLFCSTPGIPLSRAVPRKIALHMLFTGDTITAAEAQNYGLVSRIVPAEKLTETTLSVAEKICSYSRPAIAMGKSFFYAHIDRDLNSAYRYGEKIMVENLRLKDCQEGIDAFLKKRKPNWGHTPETVH